MLNQAKNVFDFLRIKFDDKSNRASVWYFPAIFSFGISIFGTWSAFHLKTGNYFTNPYFSDLFTLLSILPGFYIAALSAIAAIHRSSNPDKPAPIDKLINSNYPPYLEKIEVNRSEIFKQTLSRRVFLTMLFAYLSALSLLLTGALAIIRFIFSICDSEQLLEQNLQIHYVMMFIYFILSFVVLFAVIQIFLLTLIGINYLGYKSLVDN